MLLDVFTCVCLHNFVYLRLYMCLFAYFCVYPCMFAHIRNCVKTIRRTICCRTVPSRASGTPCGSSYGRFCVLIKKWISNRFSNSVG